MRKNLCLSSGSEVLEELNANWTTRHPGMAKLQLSDWIPWERRNIISEIGEVGVYILAKFDKSKTVPKEVDFLDENVIYIGKTNIGTTTSLRSRLNQFDRTAFHNGASHAGAENYKKKYGNDKEGLHVSICPVYFSDLHKFEELIPSESESLSSFIISRIVTPLEVCLRGIYVLTHGRLPACNKE